MRLLKSNVDVRRNLNKPPPSESVSLFHSPTRMFKHKKWNEIANDGDFDRLLVEGLHYP